MGLLKTLGKKIDKFTTKVANTTMKMGKYMWSNDPLQHLSNLAGYGGHLIGQLTGRNEAQAFAEDQFNYSKYLEENAAQIRAADMARAGLHPTLAAGSPSVVSPAGSAPSPSRVTIFDQAVMALELLKGRSEIDNINADTRQKNADATNTENMIDLNRQEAEQRVKIGEATLNQMVQDLETGTLNKPFLWAQIKWLEEQTGSSAVNTRIADEIHTIELAVAIHDLEVLMSTNLHSGQLSSEWSILKTHLFNNQEDMEANAKKIVNFYEKLPDTMKKGINERVRGLVEFINKHKYDKRSKK